MKLSFLIVLLILGARFLTAAPSFEAVKVDGRPRSEGESWEYYIKTR